MVRVTMGTMSASDAAPLPRLGEVFFDVRGDSRTMRVSWYADTGVAVFSIWQGHTCTGTFRLPIPELPRMVEALTQGPPGRGGSGSRTGGPSPRQADPGSTTTAMGPGGMSAPVPGQPGDYPPPYRDHEQTRLDRGRSDPLSAGHPGFAPGGGYQESPPTASYTGTGPGGNWVPGPGGQHQRPADGYYQDPAPGGHHDLPPGGYPDLPSDAGYPGADYHAPGNGYREPPAAPPEGPAQFAGRQRDPYPPTGPLPVGRWRTDEPSDEFPQAPPEHGFAPHGYADDRPPAGRFAADEFTPAGYTEEGFAQDEFGADGLPDDPLADSYQGEAEQGYLPSPPTDMFPAASLSGGYRSQGGHPAGYGPDPADLDHETPYPPGRGGRGGPPGDSGGHRPGRGGTREREYGHSRGRS